MLLLVQTMCTLKLQNHMHQMQIRLCDLMMVKMDDFQFENNITSKTIVNRQLNILYRNHRYRLHKYFLTFRTKEEAIQHVPEGVSIEDWKWMCDYFGSEEFKKISDNNKVNRAKNETHTTVGTKSLARVIEEKKRKEGVELLEIEVFEMKDFKKSSYYHEEVVEYDDRDG